MYTIDRRRGGDRRSFEERRRVDNPLYQLVERRKGAERRNGVERRLNEYDLLSKTKRKVVDEIISILQAQLEYHN